MEEMGISKYSVFLAHGFVRLPRAGCIFHLELRYYTGAILEGTCLKVALSFPCSNSLGRRAGSTGTDAGRIGDSKVLYSKLKYMLEMIAKRISRSWVIKAH